MVAWRSHKSGSSRFNPWISSMEPFCCWFSLKTLKFKLFPCHHLHPARIGVSGSRLWSPSIISGALISNFTPSEVSGEGLLLWELLKIILKTKKLIKRNVPEVASRILFISRLFKWLLLVTALNWSCYWFTKIKKIKKSVSKRWELQIFLLLLQTWWTPE